MKASVFPSQFQWRKICTRHKETLEVIFTSSSFHYSPCPLPKPSEAHCSLFFQGFFLILQHVYLLRRHLWGCIHVPLVKGTYWLLFQRLLVKLPESKQCLAVIYITNSKGSDSFFWLLKVHISCTDIHSVKRPIDIKIKRRRYSYHLHLFFYKFVKHGSWSWRVNIGFKFILELLAKTLHLW